MLYELFVVALRGNEHPSSHLGSHRLLDLERNGVQRNSLSPTSDHRCYYLHRDTWSYLIYPTLGSEALVWRWIMV